MTTTQDHRWRSQARCRGTGIGAFFSRTGETTTEKEAREAQAKKLCEDCPVTRECALAAILHGDVGIAGGMNDDERALYRRRLLRSGDLVAGPGRRIAPGPGTRRLLCEHCRRRGKYAGRGPEGLRLITTCWTRWVKAGRPTAVPDPVYKPRRTAA
ncbi:WhiB family transcriptional regulator [Nocardiopsis flavescens]|uniref:WhiB family transcriptional regulator n=1 Tax=Nocardiopsis flavescens TaxID=758803 RepID=UPI003655D4FF